MDEGTIRRGAVVRDLAGRKLGTVVACGADRFVIGAGATASTEYAVSYSDVSDARDGEIVLVPGLNDLREREKAQRPLPWKKRR
jgi:hypothetical protein